MNKQTDRQMVNKKTTDIWTDRQKDRQTVMWTKKTDRQTDGQSN